MPKLYILGGANGLVKPHGIKPALNKNILSPNCHFINVDTIVLRELGGYTAENIARGE